MNIKRTANIYNAIRNTHAVILAGGSGTRLGSLTRWHSKPAVPFGGKFKSIDFPLSNCINSNIRRISILTQYKSHSLNTHINRGWNFLRAELGESIDLIPAQQRIKNDWYMGTADAVFQSLDIIEQENPDHVLILAGDHIYKMDYSKMLEHHVRNNADMTIGCIEVPRKDAREFGVLSVDANDQVTSFIEKPKSPPASPNNPNTTLASMGIYLYSTDFLARQLRRDAIDTHSSHDFGKDINPYVIGKYNIIAYNFLDEETKTPAYWRDVGTVDAYYEANIELCAVTPALNLYDNEWPIFTLQEQLPPAKFVFNDNGRRGIARDSLVSSGCIVSGSDVDHSLLFNNVRIHSYCEIKDSIILNNAGIGRHCKIKNAIIDRDCIIPANTIIGYDLAQDKKRFTVSPKGVVMVSKETLEKKISHAA